MMKSGKTTVLPRLLKISAGALNTGHRRFLCQKEFVSPGVEKYTEDQKNVAQTGFFSRKRAAAGKEFLNILKIFNL
ncbi:hypothetical protein ACG2F4_17110 [Halalkalibaculum sp. DA3122]|uniref:hypothetical protein n=1 Tax=unclassified Halalkalibaculum TaxID=2964617 RepID=UPI003753F0B4